MSLVHQATCVAINGRALLIEGKPGSGKSSLALTLIDRGAVLIGDDGVTLESRGNRLLASPPPHTSGLIEVRGVGLITMPTAARIPAALVIRLDPKAPRFVEACANTNLAGIQLPMIGLWPDSPVLHLRAELALKQWGLV